LSAFDFYFQLLFDYFSLLVFILDVLAVSNILLHIKHIRKEELLIISEFLPVFSFIEKSEELLREAHIRRLK